MKQPGSRVSFANALVRRALPQTGMTLVELLVALGVGALVLVVVAALFLFGLRSFGALANYTDMDAQGRLSLDLMTKEIREATAVTGFQKGGAVRWLQLTNSQEANTVKYTWNSNSGVILCEKTGQAARTMLKGCDDWTFSFYQRTPNSNGTWAFYVT